jgi:hypothetical protein
MIFLAFFLSFFLSFFICGLFSFIPFPIHFDSSHLKLSHFISLHFSPLQFNMRITNFLFLILLLCEYCCYCYRTTFFLILTDYSFKRYISKWLPLACWKTTLSILSLSLPISLFLHFISLVLYILCFVDHGSAWSMFSYFNSTSWLKRLRVTPIPCSWHQH